MADHALDSEGSSTVTTAVPHAGGRIMFLLLVAFGVTLAAISALALFVPDFSYLTLAPTVDVIIDTTAVVVAGSITARAWIRHSASDDTDTLFHAAAFMVLFAGGLLRTGLLLAGHDLYAGFDLEAPAQAPIYVAALKRSVGAGLLLLGALAALAGRHKAQRGTKAFFLAPALVVVVVSLLVLADDNLLPVIVPPAVLGQLLQPADVIDAQLISQPMAAVQLLIGLLFLGAAITYARLAATSRQREYTIFLAAGLLVAAFAQLHYAVVPGSYEGVVSGGDLLRVLFYVLVLIGVAMAGWRDLTDLAAANRSLAAMHARDAERIALEERARLAREVHDGLVQELWLARLAHGRLRNRDDIPAEAQRIVDRVDAILDVAMGEARQAVMALQATPGTSFGSLFERVVNDYADHFGLDIECTVEDGRHALPERIAGNLLRICREALANVRKHADATVVRVHLRVTDGELMLSVDDNGVGFEPSRRESHGYGLRSMRERAEMLGAKLNIASAPAEGTRVTVVIPLPVQDEPSE